MAFDIQLTREFFGRARRANTEAARKELFIQYVTRSFADDRSAQQFIGDLGGGAERSITNIERAGRISRGRADTYSETIIIEWERNLRQTGDHAVEQLREYLQGSWTSGDRYRFVLVATDGIAWKTYAPDWSRIEGPFEISPTFELREVRSFDLSEDTLEDFPYFIDEVFFGSVDRIPTLERIQTDFGDTSPAFINAMTTFQACAQALETEGELQVAFDQWQRFLSIAYGQFDNTPNMFLVHTYLSIFSKIIAYAVLEPDATMEIDLVRAILSGEAFERRNVQRFAEDDFFHWVTSEPHFQTLRPVFREITARIREYDFSEVREDILKGLYQELVDLDTRHALGEYYTPDWLCERIVSEANLEEDDRVLDPACGSGSFLRAAIAEKRRLHPNLTANDLANQIVGIDIHPLSVQISKTTVLISLGRLLREAREPVTLNIYLANSLLVPSGAADLLGSRFTITVDNNEHALDLSQTTSVVTFDELVRFCDDMVLRFQEPIDRDRFVTLCRANVSLEGISQDLPSQLYDVYFSMKRAKDDGRDSIWKFILQNSYKPVFLRGQFDHVIGNPPWLTYGDIANSDYQDRLKALSDNYGVTPAKKNMPHLEIASIFLAHSTNYFLREGGTLIFVMPRSFMSADQHQNTREGSIAGTQLYEIWDLDDVSPLFRVPCCVLFARQAAEPRRRRRGEENTTLGRSFSGRLPAAHMHWEAARHRIEETETAWYYSTLGSSRKFKSAFTRDDLTALVGQNAYRDGFKQGATVLPRSFFFIELDQEIDSLTDLAERVIRVKTSSEAQANSKRPWDDIALTGFVNGTHIYRTALSRSLIPHALIDPAMAFVPIEKLDEQEARSPFNVMSSEALLERGFRESSIWMARAEAVWDERRTQKAADSGMDLVGRLDYQRYLSSQSYSDEDYLVLYTSSSSDACAAVIQPGQFDLPFMVEHKTYWMRFDTSEEAHYVSAFLNSFFANETITDFQSRGLLGARDIHTVILGLPFPRFDPLQTTHAEIARRAAIVAGSVIERTELYENAASSPHALGRARSAVRAAFYDELDEIDARITELCVGQSTSHLAAAQRRRETRRANYRRRMGPDLFDSEASNE